MNVVANNTAVPELIGGEAWYGKIADSLAELYIKPDIRFDNIRKWGNSIQEAMTFKQMDREEVRTRDIILQDGNAYKEYADPFALTAKALLADIEAYESGAFRQRDSLSRDSLKMRFNE